MDSKPIRSVVVLGGGTAGWMAASTMARFLDMERSTVTLVESAEIGTVGVGEATVPLMQHFNAVLGVDEAEFVRATNGTFKLGIEFRDWGPPGNVHFNGFGDFGDSIDGIAPHHHWLKLRRLGDATPLGEYSFPYVAGKLGKFAPPPDSPRSEAPFYRYAYHFDAGLYAKFLRGYAERRGVTRREARIADVELAPDTGFVRALVAEDGQRFEADFFIDCSGFDARIMNRALGVPYIDWTRWLPCDRAVAVPSAAAGRLTPYTIATAREAGWQWRIPLQHRTGNGYVYASAHSSDEDAARALLARLDGAPLAEPRVLKFTTGRRERFWAKNCLAIGLAAGFMEPLESTSIQLIQTSLARLIEWFPERDFDPVMIAEYNRVTANEWARIRDFIILHYSACQRSDSELWRRAQAMPLPDELAHKVEVFKATGRVPLLSEESYQEPSWVAIFVGQNVLPERYDCLVDRMDEDRLRAGMAHRRAAIRRIAERMPGHEDYIARYCRAPAA